MVVALSLDPVTDSAAPEAAPEPAALPAVGRLMPAVDGDLVRSYLRDIGRVPLLSHEQE
ncbi:RNA polymerase sigma factor, RpoD/SigA family, partial [Cyanobium sp. FGCU-6]|nr:RNA polymerase sigma factor, RpoD/SigA family [Cyanobium sp. FGCU6]